MVDQCRRAVAWVYRNATTFGGNPDELYLCGHSSGGHLGGCVVITDWAREGLPLTILKGTLLGSGMYDLKAPRISKRSGYVKFTDEMEEALSAQRHLDRIHAAMILTHGTLETPEFQRQSRDFHAALKAAGKARATSCGQGLQSLRDAGDSCKPLRLHGPCGDGNDEAHRASLIDLTITVSANRLAASGIPARTHEDALAESMPRRNIGSHQSGS
jgi:acetyl esterase/lipase